eukprot:COSAG05_NODE_24294_length_252_cov_0.993464_1_plen_31_part_10
MISSILVYLPRRYPEYDVRDTHWLWLAAVVG